MDDPACLPYERFAAARAPKPVNAIFESLWVAGSLSGLKRPAVAVVGTRGCTPYGRSTAYRIARDLASAGCCIISGLALGIDAAGHEGALDAGGVTIGVLGGGHGKFFPPRNRQLAERMLAAGGAVISPFEPNEPALAYKFLQRNGIVVGLSDAVVVVEAPARSGALNTASVAAGIIPVFVVPGDVDRPHFAGSHALLRDGATLVRDANDVLEGLNLTPARANANVSERPVDALQQTLFDALALQEASLESLIDVSGEQPSRVLAALSLLEIGGFIECRGGARYAAKR